MAFYIISKANRFVPVSIVKNISWLMLNMKIKKGNLIHDILISEPLTRNKNIFKALYIYVIINNIVLAFIFKTIFISIWFFMKIF